MWRSMELLYGESKRKFRPRTEHEGSEGEKRYSAPLSLSSALDGMGGQGHDPAALLPGMTQYPFYRRLGGLACRSEWVRKKLAHTRIRSSVASYYTYYAIPAHLLYGKLSKNHYVWKLFCSYVSCRSATCSRALTMKFLHVREVILESGLRNGQEISPLSAEYKRIVVIRGPFHKQARLPFVFHSF
jgi:hypothetical protein